MEIFKKEVLENHAGELFLEFSASELAQVGWSENDTIEWTEVEGGYALSVKEDSLQVFKVHQDATTPSFATSGAAGFDISACLAEGTIVSGFNKKNEGVSIKVHEASEFVQIEPGTRLLIPTGLIFDIPEGHVLKVFPRSGLSLKKGLTLSNNVGIIDHDYVHECYVILENTSEVPVTIEHGERIAQGTLEKLSKYKLETTDERPTERNSSRTGGFGSTGTKSA